MLFIVICLLSFLFGLIFLTNNKVPRDNSRVSGAILGIDGGAIISSPIRKERLKNSKKELAAEAAKVLRQADKVGCVSDDKGRTPNKFYTLPSRKENKENPKEYPSHSLDRRPKKRQGSLEHSPPRKPPRTFASPSNLSSSARPSIFDIFKKSERKTEPKKSNLRRSASDASALRSRTFDPVDSNKKVKKRSGSDSEENTKRATTKKQLTPIIEVTPREDYFATSDKENINTNIPEASGTTKDKRSESVTDQLKDYIEEVDEALYKETGIRITAPPTKKEPTPIIIDLDKAENISSNKRNKLNFGLGKKFKLLTQKKAKTNESKDQERNNVNVLVSSSPKNEFDKDFKISGEEKLSPSLTTSNIQTTIEELEKSNRSPNMIHSSQKPADKPPLTKGNTVNTMVKRLSNDSCSSPPPTRTNVLIMPNMSVQHNNNQPFSYTRGISPDKYRSIEDLPRDLPNSTKPIIYAQVVCGANGLSSGKQTIHTTYNGRRQPQSDSDEGLGGEDSLGFHRKYQPEKSFTHFGDDRLQSFLSDTDKLLDEIDKYKAESPILPKYRNPSHVNGFSSYDGIMERGRGDGMDSKRRESLTEPEMEFVLGGHSPGNNFSLNRTDLSTRRDILESRINRRINDKQTPSPEYPSNKGSRNNLYISEQSSKYYRNGSTSPVGFKEKYVSETKTDKFGERHTESRTKKVLGGPNDRLNSPGFKYNGFDNEPKSLDSQISDYRSSPENHRFESSQHSNIRSRHRTEKSKLFKDKDVYKSTPEIHHSSFPNSRGQHNNSYHDSLPREEKFQSTTSSSQLTRSERHLNREECDRRTDKFDSGIENDFRRDSSERYKPTRPTRTRRDLYNESEDEGFASSLLITSEKQHTENNLARKSRKDYDSDRNTAREDDFYRHNNSKYIPRERSIDDGSHFDPRLDKDVDRSTLKRIEKKPPKPEKRSGLDKVKSLFMRDTKKKKEKINSPQKVKSTTTYIRQEDKDEPDSKIMRSSPDYRYRRRLSTPSPSRDLPKSTKSESTHGSWFKSLDRLARRKSDKHKKEDNLTSTEEEPTTNQSKISTSTSNLRFFGDTDQESNGDSIRGTKPSKKRTGLRSQSTRDLHNISEELHKSTNTGRKTEAHHKSLTNISESNRELKGSRTNLKPPVSPSPRYKQDVAHREDRRRRKRHDISSVESSTEGDSSQQSQRSIVYLHAATVGDIPGPGYLRTGRRSASREDLTSNGSSFIQPQVKTLSRSFSVLAPWKPRHRRNGVDIDYTQYPKTAKNGKYEQKQSRNISNRNDNSTLKKKAQDSKKNNYQQSLNRKSRSKENLTSQQSKEDISRGSTSTLYKKKDKMPRENSRYNKDREDRRIPTKSQSVESISRSRDERRDVSRSVSMPRDTGKSAGWFKKTKKVPSSQRL